MLIKTGISSTKDSASSKKSRMLNKLRTGKMVLKVALAIRDVDALLAECCTVDEMQAASEGKPSPRASRGLVTIEVTE